MKILYNPTYELKDSLGYASPSDIELGSIEDLKEKLYDDYAAEDYRLASFTIHFNDSAMMMFDYPCTVSCFACVGDVLIRMSKSDDMHVSDIIHALDVYRMCV